MHYGEAFMFNVKGDKAFFDEYFMHYSQRNIYVGENHTGTDVNALTRIFLIENSDFLEQYFNTDAWMTVKALSKFILVKISSNDFSNGLRFTKKKYFSEIYILSDWF